MQTNTDNPDQNQTLCLVAGGSGGHITPALVLGAQWKLQHQNGSILFIGTKKTLDSEILKANPQITKTLLSRLINIPGKKWWLYPVFITQLTATFLKCFYYLRKTKPHKIISTGGLVAIPACAAAYLLKIPIELYELNMIPGKAIRALAPYATTIYTTFERSAQHLPAHIKKCKITGYPLRFTSNDATTNKQEVFDRINKLIAGDSLTNSRKTLFILGGSQGSTFLNSFVKKSFEQKLLSTTNLQIIHQTGLDDSFDWNAFYAHHKIPAYTFSYTNTIKDCYLLADLVLCRSGAGTLFELVFFEKKSFVIPLKSHAADHQVENAREIARLHPHLCTIFDQDEVACNMASFAQELQESLHLNNQINTPL